MYAQGLSEKFGGPGAKKFLATPQCCEMDISRNAGGNYLKLSQILVLIFLGVLNQ
jgi:hypothetical protein